MSDDTSFIDFNFIKSYVSSSYKKTESNLIKQDIRPI